MLGDFGTDPHDGFRRNIRPRLRLWAKHPGSSDSDLEQGVAAPTPHQPHIPDMEANPGKCG